MARCEPHGGQSLVNRLVEAGVLREITGYARDRRFRFDPYLRVFEEPEGRERGLTLSTFLWHPALRV
jgi:hypothetical protein